MAIACPICPVGSSGTGDTDAVGLPTSCSSRTPDPTSVGVESKLSAIAGDSSGAVGTRATKVRSAWSNIEGRSSCLSGSGMSEGMWCSGSSTFTGCLSCSMGCGASLSSIGSTFSSNGSRCAGASSTVSEKVGCTMGT